MATKDLLVMKAASPATAILFYDEQLPNVGALLEIDEDGLMKCIHDNILIQQPCCTLPDSDGNMSCDCNGVVSVYCYDCENKHMAEADIENILEGGIKGDDKTY